MVVHAPPELNVRVDLQLARQLGATVVELLPDWESYPDPTELGKVVREEGFQVHSAHGCWGARSIKAANVDLSALEPQTRAESCWDIQRCIDWLSAAGGTHLVIHPGGLADPCEFEERKAALFDSLNKLVEFASQTPVTLCLENMPNGVYPGSRMAHLAAIVAELDHPKLGLALDTGHANITGSAQSETLAASGRLLTTHVHDNDGRKDSHLPPGMGTVDFDGWVESLDTIDYRGPIMLECIRQLRKDPRLINGTFLATLRRLTRH